MFRRIRSFVIQCCEVGRFIRLVNEISAPVTVQSTMDVIRGRRRDRFDAAEELAAIMAARPGMAAVLQAKGYNWSTGKAKLIDLFSCLIRGGAGQMVGKTFVAAVPFYDPDLLGVLLELDGAEEPNKAMRMAMTSIAYVKAQEKCFEKSRGTQ